MIKQWVKVGIICCCLGSALALAQSQDGENRVPLTVAEELHALEAEFALIRENPIDWQSAKGLRQDALLYRQEERTLQLLKSFVRVSRGILDMPSDSAERGELAAKLALRDEDLEVQFTQRFQKLQERINQKELLSRDQSGTDRVIAEAEMDGLNDLRLRFLETIIDIVKIREALDFQPGGLEQVARVSLESYANERVGFIQLATDIRRAISEKLKVAPKDAELLAALNMQDYYIKQSKAISVSMVDLDVLGILLEDFRDSIQLWLAVGAADFLFQTIVFLTILFGARVLGQFSRRLVQRGLDRRPGNMSHLLRDVIVSMVSGSVFLIGLFIALSQVGISLAPMLAGLGVAGFIIGFALQDTLGNFAAGGMILIYRPFDMDDYIEVAGVDGTVKKMNLVSTTITTPDNQSLIIPNSKIWGDVIRNKTGQRVRRVDLEFGISYEDSIELAEEVFRKVLATMPAVLTEPEPNIQVIRHGESSVDFIVRPWVKTEDYWPTYWAMQRAVKLAFDEAGITIPFPQRDVHHYRSDDNPSSQGTG